MASITETQGNALIKVTLALLGVIQAGVGFMITNIYTDLGHISETQMQEKTYNTETYARRDDVLQVEKRIIERVNAGFADLKEDIRAIGK